MNTESKQRQQKLVKKQTGEQQSPDFYSITVLPQPLELTELAQGDNDGGEGPSDDRW